MRALYVKQQKEKRLIASSASLQLCALAREVPMF